MVKRISVHSVGQDSELLHIIIDRDGLVRSLRRNIDDTLRVGYISRNTSATDAQCQSIAATVLASFMNYGLTVQDLTCHDMTWDEIIRRG